MGMIHTNLNKLLVPNREYCSTQSTILVSLTNVHHYNDDEDDEMVTFAVQKSFTTPLNVAIYIPSCRMK
jgi:hypothetical protein